jgi:hypothetical protein
VSFQVAINGVNYDALENRVTIDDNAERRSSAIIHIFDDKDGGSFFTFEPFQSVEITDTNNNVAFKGVIIKPVAQLLSHDQRIWKLQCADNHFFIDKRIVARGYTNQVAGDIVKDLITNVFSSEGITAGNIDDLAVVDKMVFNYVTGDRALRTLSEYTNAVWYVDENKALNFFERTSNDAPFPIRDGDVLTKPMPYFDKANFKYRNSQFITNIKNVTDTQEEFFVGDGTRQTFNVGYPFNEIPTVELNTGSGYVTQTVGIRGTDTSQQFYVALGSTELVQEFNDAAIGTGDSIRVTYKGQYQLVALARDDAEVDRVQTLEGGGTTGFVDAATTQSGIAGTDAGIDVAASYLDRFAQTSTLLSFTTTKNTPTRLRAGQVLDFELANQDISGIFLIDQIRIRFRQGVTFYDVKCVASPPEYTFESFIRDIDDKISDAFIEISENIDTEEVLVVRADGGTESSTITELEVETVLACPLPSSSTFTDGSLLVC